MSDDNKPEFVNGLIFKLPSDGAPDFVKGSLSIRREELLTFLSSKTDEWINVDLKVSRAGKAYACVNNWSPEQKNNPAEHHSGAVDQKNPTYAQQKDEFSDDIPF